MFLQQSYHLPPPFLLDAVTGLRIYKKSPSKRFAPIALISQERAAELREVLREMLIEFLELCRQLVLKTRTVLNVPKSAPGVVPTPRAVGEERTPEEVSCRSSSSQKRAHQQ